MDNILTSVKAMLGMTEDYEYFDQSLLFHINTVFSILTQMGVGPKDGFVLYNKNAQWSDFMPEGKKLEMCKTYVFLKTRLMFDPPTSSVVLDAINRQIGELEWRINATVDPGGENSK